MINALLPPENGVALAMANPLAQADQQVAAWFHTHLSEPFATIVRALSEPGSGTWIGVVLGLAVIFLVWKRSWLALVTLVVAVPGGMWLNELVKILVQRPRPYLTGAFVDWSGYSFASGHTIGATLLYGQLALFLVPAIRNRLWKRCTIGVAGLTIGLVGFSRIALGAHYLTDVIAAIVFGILWLAFCLVISKPMRRGWPSSTVFPRAIDEVLIAPVMVPVEQTESQPSRLS